MMTERWFTGAENPIPFRPADGLRFARVAAIQVCESERFFLENGEAVRRECVAKLMGELLNHGFIHFDTSEEVTLCDDSVKPPSPPRFALRGFISVIR
jgi:hypothetical protein